MQEIERYGLITLLFLVVSAVAVSLWDGSEPNANGEGGPLALAAEVDQQRANPEAERREARRRESERLTASAPVASPTGAGRAVGGAGNPSHPGGPRGIEGSLTANSADGRAARGAGGRADQSPAGNSTPGRGPQEPSGTGGSELAWSADGRRVPAGTSSANGAASSAAPGGSQGAGAVASAGDRRGGPQSPVGTGTVERRNGVERGAGATAALEPLRVELPEGETLSHLAQRYLGKASRWHEIAAANPHLNPDRVTAGTLVTIPRTEDSAQDSAVDSALVARTESAPAADPVSVTGREALAGADENPAAGGQAPAGTRAYQVARGDSAWKISERELGNGARYVELVELNPHLNLDRLDEGDVLYLPMGAVASVSQPRQSRVR